tara:strand:+ start:813 stop:950 length:138 start_codon:yes stop_codon:yes gene_type:complete
MFRLEQKLIVVQHVDFATHWNANKIIKRKIIPKNDNWPSLTGTKI